MDRIVGGVESSGSNECNWCFANRCDVLSEQLFRLHRGFDSLMTHLHAFRNRSSCGVLLAVVARHAGDFQPVIEVLRIEFTLHRDHVPRGLFVAGLCGVVLRIVAIGALISERSGHELHRRKEVRCWHPFKGLDVLEYLFARWPCGGLLGGEDSDRRDPEGEKEQMSNAAFHAGDYV